MGHITAMRRGPLAMLNRCANPECRTRFRKLEDGKLFLLEAEATAGEGAERRGESRTERRLEHYWLCDPCSSVLTLSFERERGVVVVPLTPASWKKPAVSERSGAGGNIGLAGIYPPATVRRGRSNGA